MAERPLQPPRAVLFDMDGTLTRPMIDFDAIRAEIGITGPILEAIRHFPADRRAHADAVLDRHELAAAHASELHDECGELLADLAARSIPVALVTRNSCRAMNIVLAKHGLRFDHCVSREDTPAKPHPECVWRVCRALRIEAGDAWMVGDSHHDVEAGAAAGSVTVWLRHDPLATVLPTPDVTIDRLSDLRPLLAKAGTRRAAASVSEEA